MKSYIYKLADFLNSRERVFIFLYNNEPINKKKHDMLEYIRFAYFVNPELHLIQIYLSIYNKKDIKYIKSTTFDINIGKDIDISPLDNFNIPMSVIKDVLQSVADYSNKEFFIMNKDKYIDYVKPLNVTINISKKRRK